MGDARADTLPPRLTELASQLRVLVGQLRRRMQDRGHLGDLTPSQVAVLRRLERDGPATVTALARGEGMRPQSMGANVAVLEAGSLVSGAPDPNDGRQTLFSLTTACRERILAGRLAREDWLLHALRKTLTSREQEELSRAVLLLRRLAES